MTMASQSLTPLMRQYFSIKESYPDMILLFQVGDFYELFFDDAVTAASILGVALTKRGTHNGKPIPLCGVPLHVRDHYLTKLVKAGFKVALCDQLEEPVPGTIVKRGVTQVLTPGTLTDTRLLDEKSASFLAFFVPGTSWVFACVELLTGVLYLTPIKNGSQTDLDAELSRFMPDEIVLPAYKKAAEWAPFFQKQGYCISLEAEVSEATMVAARNWFTGQFPHESLTPEVSLVVAYIYSYLQRTHERGLLNIKQFALCLPQDYVFLDAATQRNLELIKNAQDGSTKHSLFSVLDTAITPMGSRLLKKWIIRPLLSYLRIEERLDAVSDLVQDHSCKIALRKQLSTVGDVERIVGRIALGRAYLHDYLSLCAALEAVPDLKTLILARDPALFKKIGSTMRDFSELKELLSSSLHDTSTTHWLIKKGYNEELDRLRLLVEQGAQAISLFEKSEQQKTGISSLKVTYNKVHGYAIEVTKPNVAHVPDYFIRTQTLVNRERYTTQELKNLEHDLERARSEIGQIEKDVYESVKQQVEQYVPDLKKLAYALAYTDALAALAECAYTNRYVRPTFSQNRDISIREGRHPVVEVRLKEDFIPNGVELNDEASLWLITGPNMGGKSTFLRQVALISLLAQIGSWVPASYARLAIVDRIFTRIGASDNVAEGKSTFLVEMEETALICSQATAQSLVILDEVGRGTSTFDGLAIAQAVVEYIHTSLKARCLFATHYHELTALCDVVPGIKPFYAASTKVGGTVVLLHKIMPGVADGSFGLEVAALAQLPESVVRRAREILSGLKHQELTQNTTMNVYGPSEEPLRVKELEASIASLERERSVEKFLAAQVAQIDYDNLTPKQALDLLWRLKEDAL